MNSAICLNDGCKNALTETQVKQGGQYCCLTCANRHNRDRVAKTLHCSSLEKYEQEPKLCKFCKKKLEYSKRRNNFCDHSCAAAFNNCGVRRRGLPPGKCLNCGKKLTASRYKCCSHKCSNTYRRKCFIERWLEGKEKGYNGGRKSGERLKSVIKDWLYETRGTACEKCQWDGHHPVTGNPCTQINHIDGNARNNRPENLEVICPNCHSLTDNFGALNKGNGRKGRYKSTE